MLTCAPCPVGRPTSPLNRRESSGDFDAYLAAAGATRPVNLLPAGPGVGGCQEAVSGDEGGHVDLMALLGDAVARALGLTGHALGFLGGWFRDRLAFLRPAGAEQQEGDERQRGGSAAAFATAFGGSEDSAEASRRSEMLRNVVLVAVMVIALVVFRRPMCSFRFARGL